MQDDEYIPHGEDIEAFLKREIAKPIIRWEDSPQLGYEILPNKYFYRYQPPYTCEGPAGGVLENGGGSGEDIGDIRAMMLVESQEPWLGKVPGEWVGTRIRNVSRLSPGYSGKPARR